MDGISEHTSISFIATGAVSSLIVVIGSAQPTEAIGAALIAALVGGGLFQAIYVLSAAKLLATVMPTWALVLGYCSPIQYSCGLLSP